MKAPHVRVVGLSIVVLAGLCTALPVDAQDIQSQISEKVGDLNERFGSGNNGETQRRRERAEERFGELENAIEAPERASLIDPRFEIVSHHRASDGIPFPDASETILEPSTSSPQVSRAQRPTEYWVSPQRKVSRPPRCTESGTRTIQRREKGAAGELVFDRLYVSQELAPVDTSDIYGVETKVEIYDGDSSAEVSLRMEVDAVPCLPYRIRFTDTQAFYHRGEDAIMNYDKDPTGRGLTHPWVRRKIEAGALRR